MLKEEDIGWVTRPENPLDLAEAIRSAAAHPEETQAKGRRAAMTAQRYTYDRAIASYRQVISDVIRLLAMHINVRQNQWHSKRLRLLHRCAPAFKTRRIYQCHGSAQQSVHVRQRNHSKISEILFKAAPHNLAHDRVKILGFSSVMLAA
jgi:hypothetical protein